MAAFKVGQIVRCIQFDESPTLVGNVGKITAETEYMGVHVLWFDGDRSWHEYPDRELEWLDVETFEAWLRTRLAEISALNAEVSRLRYELEHVVNVDGAA